MTVKTSISNQNRQVKIDERHVIKFDSMTAESLRTKCLPTNINSILEKILNLFTEKSRQLQVSNMDLRERLVFGIILYKKNKYDMEIRVTQEQFDALVYDIRTRKCTKRPEEKLKFIFKRSLKYLLKKFSQEQSQNEKFNSNKSLLKRFNEYYYTDIAKKLNLSISEFFPPNRSKNDSGSFNKTLNLQYLAKLAKNPKILSSMIDYIDHMFLKDYLIELKASLHSLIIKITAMIYSQYHKINISANVQKPTKVFQQNEINSLTNLISNNFNSQLVENELNTVNNQEGVILAVRLFREMKATILKQKMRIPWTVKEVQSGIQFVKKKLLRIQKKNEGMCGVHG